MMLVSLFYMLLALLALSFLIFVHELGHYWMARRVGMRVETFAIGFGNPIWSWESQGTRWQIGWLPFGGYVKIAGVDNSETDDPYQVADGFYGKGPWARIKVAFMGPFVNLMLAFLLFGLLWLVGGRTQNFSENTHKIGWVDPQSELYAHGIRPGDEISAYDGRPFNNFKDHIYASLLASDEVRVAGFRHDYDTGSKVPFEYKVKPYSPELSQSAKVVSGGKPLKSLGIQAPASYMIYDEFESPVMAESPVGNAGILKGDRIVWADGIQIFSPVQLAHILNDGRVLLTVERQGKVFLARVPRVHADELKYDRNFREELADWQFEAQLNKIKTSALYTLPYNFDSQCVVEGELVFIDRDRDNQLRSYKPYASIEAPLQAGDKVIAVGGAPVALSFQMLAELQNPQVNVIVERNPDALKEISWREADQSFDRYVDAADLKRIALSIGTSTPIAAASDLLLLKGIHPAPYASLMARQPPTSQSRQQWELLKETIDKIDNPDKRSSAQELLKQQGGQLALGFAHRDRKVNYNPDPIELTSDVFKEIGRTLGHLINGSLKVEAISGPIGIVFVQYGNWANGIFQGIFWLGAISLNLGILNLLPIPVLDGGTIFLSFIEMITGKKIPPKVLEKITLPFALLLLVFFVVVSYNDLHAIFRRLLSW
jgi:regulator of sigma E protease